MAGVTKYVRYAAPYRSKTFNDKDALIFGRNGVVTGGEVSQSGNTATIQPVTIVQNGQIVDIAVALSQAVPATLVAPFYIAISISSPIENATETITPVFVKRPQDINNMVVLIAEWDGAEWRSLPKLQLSEQIEAAAKTNVTNELTGVSHGMNVSVSAGNYVVDAGVVIASDGSNVVKNSATSIPVVGDAANISQAFDRIDSLVFRKPSDSPYRIGTIKNIVGPTFVDVSGTATDPVGVLTSTSVSKIRTK